MILGYLLIATPETLKKWKVAITLVGQKYKSIEGYHDYWTETETTYGGQGIPIDIGKTKENFDKDKKPKCFNCKIYRHMVKNVQSWRKKRTLRNVINVDE